MKKTWMLITVVAFVLLGVLLGSLIWMPVATSAPLAQIASWTPTTPMPDTLTYHGVAIQNGFLYVSGGNKNPAPADIIQTVRVAKIETNGIGAWNLVKELPIELFQHAMVAAGDYLYVIGGWDGKSARSDVFRAKPANGTITQWDKISEDYPTRINFHDAAVVKDRIYVVGGRINNDVRTNEVRYAAVTAADGSLGSWTAVQGLPQAVSAAAVVAHNGYLYVTGGFNGTTALDTVYYAKVGDDGNITTWQTATFTGARYFHEALVVDNKLIILGGTDGAEKVDVLAAPINSDGSLGAWVAQSPLPESLQQFAAVAVEQTGGNFLSFVLGGQHGVDFRNQVYVASFTRPTPTPTVTPTPTNTPTPTPTPTPGLIVSLYNRPPANVDYGQTITYTIHYSNNKSATLSNVVFTNTIPYITMTVPFIGRQMLEVVNISQNGNQTADQIRWEIGPVAITAGGSVSYVVKLPEILPLSPSPTPTATAPVVENKGAAATWTYSGTTYMTTTNFTFNNSPVNFLPFVPRDGVIPTPTPTSTAVGE